MKFLRLSSLSPALLALATLLLSAPAHAERPIDATVVAEQSAPATARPSPAAGAALSCVIHEGGYIEAGDPVAGEQPPTADAVRSVLHATLATAGYQPGAAPALLLTYHWGVLRRDSHAIRRPYDIDPNLRARLALVASSSVVGRAEDYFHAGRAGFVDPSLRDAFELSRDARYFLIVSAYNYADARQGRATLLWRTRLSAMDNSGEMGAVISALAASAGPYLSQNFRIPKHPSLPRTFAAAASSANPAPADLPADFLARVVRQEHDDFAGLLPPAERSAQASHGGSLD